MRIFELIRSYLSSSVTYHLFLSKLLTDEKFISPEAEAATRRVLRGRIGMSLENHSLSQPRTTCYDSCFNAKPENDFLVTFVSDTFLGWRILRSGPSATAEESKAYICCF